MRKLWDLPIPASSKVTGDIVIDQGALKVRVSGGGGDLKADISLSCPVAKIVEPIKHLVVEKLEEKLRSIGGIGVSAAEFVDDLWDKAIAGLSEAPAAPVEGQA